MRGTSLANVIRMQQEGMHPKALQLPLKGQFDVMIIAESPGRMEESVKIPVQDEAGELLVSYCEKAGLDPDRVYVTYIVKCNPPRPKATVKEVNLCREIQLFPEIEAVSPKVVLLLGNLSLRAFNLHNLGSMNSIHGQVFQRALPGDATLYNVIPTFNPSMFIYRPNPRLQQRVTQDYHNVKLVLDGDEVNGKVDSKWHLCNTMEQVDWLIEQMKGKERIACDTESCALPWYREHLLCTSFAWGYPNKCAMVPFWKHVVDGEEDELEPVWTPDELIEVRDKMASILENPSIQKIFHNFKYDACVLRKWANIRVKGFIRDTMVFHHLLHEEGSHKLEDLADEEFNYGDYSSGIREITGVGKKLLKKFNCVPDETLWPYGATDAECCFRLDEVYSKRFEEKMHLWNVYIEESEPLLHALIKAEWNGHKLNTNLLPPLKEEYKLRQTKLLSDMKALTHPGFKPLSPTQVKDALIKLGLGDKIRDKKAASGYRTDKNVLSDMMDDVPLAEMILAYRGNRKIISTYIDNAVEEVDIDGRIRHSWFPLTVTGRLSCRFFHQIPKADPERIKQGLPVLRDMFIVEPGYTMVYGDYSQVELRILAIESQDQEMLRLMNDPKADLHAASTYEFLRRVWPEYTEAMAKIDKFNRAEVGKRINFGLAYGSVGHSLVKTGKWRDSDGKERPFTWEMLNEGMKRWRDRFPGCGQYLEDVPAQARRNGGIVWNCFHRERRLGGRLSLADKYKRGEAEREAVNFPIQSAAGAITNRTIGLIDRVLDQHIEEKLIGEDDVRLINTVHDSVAYEVRDSHVDWFISVLKQIGERPIPQLRDNKFKMDIELHFKVNEQITEVKKYTYENIQQAAYFMGLLQQGVKFGGEMYVMEDHYLDVDEGTVIVNCITIMEAEKKVAAINNRQVSPEFLEKLAPAFRTDNGDGGCGGEGGGFLN
jgi:uracil-DNA glycosylase family 4